nr:hypothetical protein Iba_chr04eCG13690 [Ipomoea batatas]
MPPVPAAAHPPSLLVAVKERLINQVPITVKLGRRLESVKEKFRLVNEMKVEVDAYLPEVDKRRVEGSTGAKEAAIVRAFTQRAAEADDIDDWCGSHSCCLLASFL